MNQMGRFEGLPLYRTQCKMGSLKTLKLTKQQQQKIGEKKTIMYPYGKEGMNEKMCF
jgi:hypothetical protein